MDQLKDWHNKAYYGFAMVLMLGILFLVQIASWIHLSGEGFHVLDHLNGYHPALGGPKGASPISLSDHTGASGDHSGHDVHSYNEQDMAIHDPELYLDTAPESFLNSRFPGPAFYESGAKMYHSMSAPMLAQIRENQRALAALTQPPAVTEITQGTGNNTESFISDACNYEPVVRENVSAHIAGGGCGGSHSFHNVNEDGLFLEAH